MSKNIVREVKRKLKASEEANILGEFVKDEILVSFMIF
jgi:hypothetical protein